MGNSSAKKTNKLLDENRKQINTASNTAFDRSAADRTFADDTRSRVAGEYWNILNGMGSGTGSGGGGGNTYKPIAINDNEAMNTYRNFMKTGGYSPEQQRDFRLRSEAVIPSFFEGVRRNMNEAANIRGGGYAGYSGQLAMLARQKAQEAERARLEGEVTLQDKIREGILTGAGGVERLDKEKQALLRAEQQRKQQMQAAAAGRSRAAADDDYRRRMAVLGELRGLRGESGSDTAYFDRGMQGLGAAQNAVTSRVNEPGFLETAAGLITPLASAALPFLGGSGPKKPSGSSFGPYAGGYNFPG
jgi:hypothetical protein